MLDGFKRLSAARNLSMSKLTACRLTASLRAGKAVMLHLNRLVAGDRKLVIKLLENPHACSQLLIDPPRALTREPMEIDPAIAAVLRPAAKAF